MVEYIDVDKIDTTQLVDDLELSTILNCGGVLMLDAKNPTENTLYVVYINTGGLKISKVQI